MCQFNEHPGYLPQRAGIKAAVSLFKGVWQWIKKGYDKLMVFHGWSQPVPLVPNGSFWQRNGGGKPTENGGREPREDE